jgi:hypothetical protein
MKTIKLITAITLLLLILSFLTMVAQAQPSCYNWKEIPDAVSVPITPSVNPHSYRPIYDSESDVILFIDGPNKIIYAYNATSNSFSQLSSPTMPDYVQYGYYQQYDETNDVVILFGGHYPQTVDPNMLGQNETWAYDYNTNTWTNMNPTISPPRRGNAFLSYDSNTGKMLLYGGVDRWVNVQTFYTDVWAYDYALNNWTNVTPSSGPSPGPRIGYLWSFDPILNKTLLFGGSTTVDLPYWDFQNDMWAYDLGSKSWTEITPSFRPSKRVYTNMVYDSNSSKTLLFGGVASWSPRVFLDDFWVFDSLTLTWKNTSCEIKPSERMSLMVFHSKSYKTYLYGGWSGGFSGLDDFWILTYDETCDCFIIPEFSEILFFTTVPLVVIAAIILYKRRKK